MKRVYYYIAITSLFYVISFAGVSAWFWYHVSDANVSAAYFVFEPNVGEEEPFEPYIRRDGTYGQVSEFFNFRESDLYKRVKETHQGEIYRSKHANYEGQYIFTYCTPFYENGQFAGIFGMDVPIRTHWLLAITLIALLGISMLIWFALKIYKNVRQMAVKDAQRDEQLHLASELQKQILPTVLPKHPAVDISTEYKPAQNIGGDLYDVRLEENDLLTFCIGDISGHGIPAALLMSQVLGIFRSTHGAPAEIMNAINIVIAKDNLDLQFCTMFIGQLNLANGQLVFCNAGHPIPELNFVDSSRNTQLQNSMVMPPLGIDANIQYKEERTIIPMGATLALFTDGVYEDEDDDISRLNITWKARLESLHAWLLAQGVENNMCELAIEEALANAVKHSTATSIALLPSGMLDTFTLCDNGVPFDSTMAISQSDGVGLDLIRKIAQPQYERKGDINVLTLHFS